MPNVFRYLPSHFSLTMMKRFIDIGANLTDLMYLGKYHTSQKHEPDLKDVLQRSWSGGLEKIIITGGSLEDAKSSLELANSDDRLYCTVGCHPTRCKEFEENPDEYLNSLEKLIQDNPKKVVALGEMGLDYDRLTFCDKETQKKYFELQLTLCDKIKLPLFLHCRAASEDFLEILKRNINCIHGGVVHSFDGTKDDVERILELGLYIGINGCSLKTLDNLNVVKSIPLESLLIETDAPWCEIKPTHASFEYVKTKFPAVKKEKWQAGCMVKGRNEPVNIIQVLEVLAGVKQEDREHVARVVYDNTMKLFFPCL